MSGILRLESLTKGNTLKQGDKTPLKYRLFDADGEKLNIAGKSAKVRLVYPDFLTIGYEKDGLTVAQDDTVTFTIDGVIPSRIYHVEIIVDGQFIFPSRSDESKFTVDKSSLGTEANIIEIVGVDAVVRKAVDLINVDPSLIIDEDKLVTDIISNTGIGSIEEYHQQFDNVIKELSEEKDYHSLPEISAARGGFDTLGERLNETTEQLAHKANDSEVRKKHIPIGLNDFDGEALGVIQDGTGGTPINIESIPRNGSVSKEKTTFFRVTSRNKFDKKTAQKNKSLGLDGILYDSTEFFVSDLIPTKSGDIWKASHNMQTYVIYNADGEKQSGKTNYGQSTFTVNIDGFIRVGVWHTAFDKFMITNESLPSEYEEFSYVITRDNIEPIPDNSLGLEKLSFVKTVSRNLFDKSVAVEGVLGGDGDVYPGATFFTTDYIPTRVGDVWETTNPLQTYVVYDESKVKVQSETSYNKKTFESEHNGYIRVSVFHTTKDSFMISNKGLPDQYEPYKYGIPKEFLEAQDSSAKINKYEIEENIDGIYERTDTEYLNSWTMTSVEVYQVFDGIVNDFPNWASRVQYGTSADGKPIYKYTFKPEMTQKERVEQSIPLFVVTNTHSFEKPALAGTTQFFKDLAYNWKSNNELRIMRWNIHFEVIPVVNPYGVDNRSRPNSNGVDINRNFTAGWNTEGDNGVFGTDYYAGTEPMSEPETKTLDKLMNEYKHADYAIDVHNYTTLAVSSSVLWVGSNESETRSKLTGFVHQTASIAQAKYIDGNVSGYENKALGLVENNNPYGGATVWQWESYGVPATLLELVSDFGTTPQEVQQFSVEAIGNLILNGLRKFVLGN